MIANEIYIDLDLRDRYEFFDYGHALEILHESFPAEWAEIQKALRQLELTKDDISRAGGNESPIPKKFDEVLFPCGWREIRISGDLIVKKYPRQSAQRRGRFADKPFEIETIKGYIDGHNIDFLKNKVAFDVGVIVTRSEELNEIFKEIGIIAKYGASTTWMGKLLYRLDSRRNGGCPVLAVGIKKGCVKDYE